jgi:hypothetical protein
MLEVIITIILVPAALVAIGITVAIGAGIIKAFKKKK